VTGLIDEPRDVVTEAAHAIDDRRQENRRATPVTTTIPRTSTEEHSPRLHGRRRLMASTTGARTAALKTATKISSRTWPIDASAQASATATPTSRIVRMEMNTASSR
jgi:hypothetical protein